MSNTQYSTAGAIAVCAVNTKSGRTTVTFYGNARHCKGSGEDDFRHNRCNSAARDCRNEKGVNTVWGQSMKMAQHVCKWANGKNLPNGVKFYPN